MKCRFEFLMSPMCGLSRPKEVEDSYSRLENSMRDLLKDIDSFKKKTEEVYHFLQGKKEISFYTSGDAEHTAANYRQNKIEVMKANEKHREFEESLVKLHEGSKKFDFEISMVMSSKECLPER